MQKQSTNFNSELMKTALSTIEARKAKLWGETIQAKPRPMTQSMF